MYFSDDKQNLELTKKPFTLIYAKVLLADPYGRDVTESDFIKTSPIIYMRFVAIVVKRERCRG